MKLRKWCLTHPVTGANSLKLFLSEVTVSLKMIDGSSRLKNSLYISNFSNIFEKDVSLMQNMSPMVF